jgi:hypothetical protein
LDGADVGRQWPTVEKLQPAPTAVKHPALAHQAFHKIEESAVLPVDLIGRFEAHYPVAATGRAAAGWTQMVPEAARSVLLLLAHTALIDRHVVEAFEECPVDPPESSAALLTHHLWTVIPNLRKRHKPRDNRKTANQFTT